MNAEKVFRSVVVLTLTAALAAISLGLFAQVTPPGLVNYQGVLRDALGKPVADGNYDMTFFFYDGPTGGTLLLTDSHTGSGAVPVSGGLFTVALGSGTLTTGSESTLPAVFANHAAVYLAVKVGSDAEMTPRIQVVSAPFAENCDTLDGKHATDFIAASSSGNFLNTSSTAQTKAEKLTLNGATDYGINASGPVAGGYFKDSNNSGYAYVGIGDYGISAYGNTTGGYFKDANNSGYAYVGYGDDGIDAYGNNAGGYFKDANNSGYAYVGKGDYGIDASGNGAGGFFQDLNDSGRACAGCGDDGIDAYGNNAGGSFAGSSSGFANVGISTYKIQGNGTVSFVQNHPTEKDKVIVYACPEGDEVATYTRGTAKLVNGEARVKLGDTFKWVTNPDIGLTAHLTPHGEAVPLAVESLSTSELVVRGPKDAPADLAFDYLVYGLRIGFEESSIVQEKQRESYIPSCKDHRERYAKFPELRAFNALERFKTMESSVRGVEPASIDLSHAKALHDAIHEYDPATDPPVEKLFGHDHGHDHGNPPAHAVPATGRPAVVQNPGVAASANGGTSAPAASAGTGSATSALPVDADGNIYGKSFRPASPDFASSFPVCGPVEAGDILVTDANHPGLFCRSLIANDPGVVGVVAGEPGLLLGSAPKGTEPAILSAPVATSGVIKVKVDAGYGPIALNDLLVASPTPGHAMRADNPAQGTVIGKALEPLPNGTGLIKVLVMLR
jgi:hypothetical protein